jgi:PucR family transcriptional regulator, purine catabolism regulatory protein
MLTLADVLDQQEFGLRLLTADGTGPQRRIAGAHNSEMAEPAEFLPPDWLLLTLGMTLRTGAAQQRALIANLDDAAISALGFGVGVAFDEVPSPLLQEAERRAFPVFEIPYRTPYREVIGFVNRSLLSNDFRLVQRSLSMQNYLMDALRDDAPTRSLLQRLGQLLNSTIILFDAQGSVEAASGVARAEEIWAEVRDRGETSMHRALVDGAPVVSIPIDASDRPRRWLVIVSRGRSLPTQLASSVIHSSERLLELIALSQRAADAEDRVRRGELLTAALQPLRGASQDEVTARLASYGIDFASPARVLVVRGGPAQEPSADALRVAIERCLSAASLPYLTLLRGQELLLLTQVEGDSLRALAESMLETSGGAATVGAGRPARSVVDIREALRDAEAAVAELAHEGRGGIRLFEELRLAGWLLGHAPAAGLRAAVEGILAPLDEHPDLYRTLVVYLQHEGRVASAAAALNLHENSLRYRLSRIEGLLDRSLRDFPTLVDLHLATLARDATRVFDADALRPDAGGRPR